MSADRRPSLLTLVVCAFFALPAATSFAAANDLEVTAASPSGAATRGATTTLTTGFRNYGPAATASATTLTSVLPDGYSFVSASGGGWSCSAGGQTVRCTSSAAVAAGAASEASVLTLRVGTTAPAQSAARVGVENGGDANAANNGRDVSLEAAWERDTAATLSPTSFSGNFTGTLFGTAQNVGTAATSGPVTTTITLPPAVAFLGTDTDGCILGATPREIVCTSQGSIARGSSSFFSIRVQASAAAAPSFVVTARTSSPNDQNAANDATQATYRVFLPPAAAPAPPPPVAPDFSVAIAAGGSLKALGRGTIVFKVQRTTTTRATTTLRITLPSTLTTSVMANGGWACTPGAPLVCTTRSRTVGPLRLSVDIAAAAAPSVVVGAVVANEDDANPANDAATATIPVAAAKPVTKTVSRGTTKLSLRVGQVLKLAIQPVAKGRRVTIRASNRRVAVREVHKTRRGAAGTFAALTPGAAKLVVTTRRRGGRSRRLVTVSIRVTP